MWFLRWVVTFLVLLFSVWFATANLDPVSLNNPWTGEYHTMPVAVLVLGCIAVGMVIWGVVSFFASLGLRRDIRLLKRRNRELKDLLYRKLYRHHRVVRMQVKAERIISDLFHAYRAEPAMLPDHIQFFIEKRGLERTICDYIAGMTDRYAIEEHQKLFNPFERP